MRVEPPADFEVKRPHLLVRCYFLAVGTDAFVLKLLGDAMGVKNVPAGQAGEVVAEKVVADGAER